MNPEITFFTKYGDGQDRAAMEEIANEASDRGYGITFSTDYSTPAEIGVYARYRPEMNSKLSVVMFHGIDDAYNQTYWPGPDWGQFDIGLLPGKRAVENWKNQSHHPEAKPRLGAFEVGWPKADRVVSDEFEQKVNNIASELELHSERVILYAPTSEDHGKIHQFVDHCGEVADKLLIKHAPYEQLAYTDEYDSLDELYAVYDSDDDIHIFDPTDDIMVCLSLADIVVSDQSSVLNEAMLTNTIPVSVSDWPIRSGSIASEKDFRTDFVIDTCERNLNQTVQEVYNEYEDLTSELKREQNEHYSFLGESSALILDLIESVIEGTEYPVQPVEPKPSPLAYGLYYNLRRILVNAMPNSTIRLLENSGIHNTEDTIKNALR